MKMTFLQIWTNSLFNFIVWIYCCVHNCKPSYFWFKTNTTHRFFFVVVVSFDFGPKKYNLSIQIMQLINTNWVLKGLLKNQIQSCYDGKLLSCKHIMNIYELFFMVQWQLRKLCGFLKLHCQRGSDFSRAKWVILSHADWFGCIWMTLLTPSGISSCLCALLESELHFEESPMFILASSLGPRQRHPGHLYAALTLPSPCSNWLTNINRNLVSIDTTLHTDLL